MEKRRLGKTGLEVSVIGFGGIPIQRLPMRKAREIIRLAIDRGINFFDTAQGYGDSEVKIGEGIKGKRDKCIIATKSPCRKEKEAIQHVEKALKRLKVDFIDLYQIHHVSKSSELEMVISCGGALDGLLKLKEEGKIKHIGITGHNPSLLKEAIEKREEFETVQFPFNIVEDEEDKFSLIKAAKNLSVGTIIMKPLAGGVLPHPSLCLRWILQQGVDTVIPGMILPSEVEENVKVGEEVLPLSEKELSLLKDSVKELEKEFCRRCMYCMPCPEGIHIYLIQELGDKVKVGVEEVKKMCQEMYTRLPKNVEDCTECGECEEKCPYNLPVRKMLREKHRLLTQRI
ncbi:aldo/keto reductase [Candidatus Aerophobetes bacterium]|nr:aldo/keto reductase [Candidatus Aerophobetes bacterium]